MSKKTLLLFAQSTVKKGLGDPAALASLLSANDHIVASWAYLDDLVFDLSDPAQPGLYDVRNEHAITEYDSVYFRYWAAQEGQANAAARICATLNVPFIDGEVARIGSRNKLSQYVWLHEAGIAIPRTLVGTVPHLIAYYEAASFSFPFIMKDKSGTRGQTNFLIHSAAEMDSLATDYADRTFILQDFIPNDGDFRVFVAGGQVKLILERKAVDGSHLNNISQGGSANLVPTETLPPEVLDMSVRAAALFGRDVAGVDIVQSKANGQYYCFEVNRAPQIEHASFQVEKAAVLAEYLATL